MKSQERVWLWGILLLVAFGAGIVVARLPDFSPVAELTPCTPTPLARQATPPTTPAPTFPAAIETIYLDFRPAAWDRIVAKRAEALQRGILVVGKKDYVPATLHYGTETLPVEVRLKGDWIDHLFYDKWSFRVHVTGDGALYGMKLFSLQDPGRRSYLNEWLFLENLRQEHVLAVRYHFVHLILNGQNKGIYAVEESFAKELLESQQRREGPIIRWDEDLMWTYRSLYDDQLIPRGVNDYHLLDAFQSARIAANPTLSTEAQTAAGMLRAVTEGTRPASEVFDQEAMGKFLALSDLWCAPHGLIWHNLRFYYDPVAAHLEPIAYDNDVFDCDLEMAGLSSEHFYGDPRLQRAYLQTAWRVSDPAYLTHLRAALEPAYNELHDELATEFDETQLAPPWDTLRRRQQLMREVLQPYRTAYAFTVRPLTPTTAITLAVGNLLPYPLAITSLEVNGSRLPLADSWYTLTETAFRAADGTLVLRPLPDQAQTMPYFTLHLPPDVLSPTAKAKLITRLWGLTEEHRDPIVSAYPPPLPHGPQPTRPTWDEALRRYPFLVPGGADKLTVRPGSWDVDGDLVLPSGVALHISGGTTLRFASGAILFLDAPLDLEGEPDAPVQLLPQRDTWGGVVVLSARDPSFWHHALISATTGISRDGWLLSGGVTFYRSPLRLTDSQLLHSRAEDTLNIVRGRFALARVEFGWTASDALDVDFGSGDIDQCSFHDVGGDGVDVSGTQATVSEARMARINDKGISAGEISRVDVQDCTLADVGFGVVSKDLSQVTVQGLRIDGPRVAALAVYVKKPTYGPASLIADNITFDHTDAAQQTLVQAGCTLRLDGTLIPGVTVDVGSLYGK